MAVLSLDDMQVESLKQAGRKVVVCDSVGKTIGVLLLIDATEGDPPISIDEVKEIARQSTPGGERWYTTEEVLERLRKLDAQ